MSSLLTPHPLHVQWHLWNEFRYQQHSSYTQIYIYLYDRPDFSLKLNRDLFYILNLSSPLYFHLVSYPGRNTKNWLVIYPAGLNSQSSSVNQWVAKPFWFHCLKLQFFHLSCVSHCSSLSYFSMLFLNIFCQVSTHFRWHVFCINIKPTEDSWRNNGTHRYFCCYTT